MFHVIFVTNHMLRNHFWILRNKSNKVNRIYTRHKLKGDGRNNRL